MEFGILGPLEVVANGRPLSLGGLKQRALLTMLLLEPNRVVSTDRLVDALWGERPTSTARTALHGLVSELRKALGSERDRLVTLVATGPLTNVALLLDRTDARPEQIVLIGGSIAVGNVTPAAEFNVWADPEAADRAYSGGVQGGSRQERSRYWGKTLTLYACRASAYA